MATVVNSPGRRKDWWTSAFTKGPADTPTPHQPSPWWKMGKNLWSHLKKLKDFTAAKKEDGSESTLMTDGKLSMKRIRDLMIKTLLWYKWHHCRRKKRLNLHMLLVKAKSSSAVRTRIEKMPTFCTFSALTTRPSYHLPGT